MAKTESGLVYALVGNPNCGKTTLFNALTGMKQKVGNYPGVTVEKKEGSFFSQHGEKIHVIDLPGAYSLNARSPDEAVMRDVLLGRRPETPKPDRVVCVVDANNLERNLYLVSQVLELGLPVIIALNMVDVAESRGLRLDPARLSEKLGCPVVVTVASSRKGLVELKLAMSRREIAAARPFLDAIPVQYRGALVRQRETLAAQGVVQLSASPLESLYLLSDHDPESSSLIPQHRKIVTTSREQMEREFPNWEDTLVASRYDSIHSLCQDVLCRPDSDTRTWTDRLDDLMLHWAYGWVFLLASLGVLFYLIFRGAEAPMGFIEGVIEGISQKFTGYVDEATGAEIPGWMAPGDLRSLIVDGALAGVAGVLVFLPQILILFFFIGIMEETGYMARIAFIMDRVMSKVGLTGKSFLPLLSSYACAVPGVMATRTIDHAKDRLVTMLVVPLASCSARLPVYSLLIAVMIPSELLSAWTKALVMMAMYLLGTLGAFFFAWLFRRKLIPGSSGTLVLELPAYKRPSLKAIFHQLFQRCWMFVRRAGTVIMGLSILLWAAMTYPKSTDADKSKQVENSIGGRLGHFIEPAIKPLGYDWKIGIGLISSFAAREVFVSSMGVIYAVEEGEEEDTSALEERMRSETWPDGSKIYTAPVCIGLMVFFVFAMQCLSTVAVVRRESGSWKWALFQFTYMTVTAYVLALIVYQIGSLFS